MTHTTMGQLCNRPQVAIKPNFIDKWGQSGGAGEPGSGGRGDSQGHPHAVHLLIDNRNEKGS